MTDSAAEWLEKEGAQRDVVAWARDTGAGWDELWRSCPRADWMIAIALRRGVPSERVVEAGRAVARLALDHFEGDERARIDAALRAPSEDAAMALAASAEGSPDPVHQAALAAVEIALRGAPDEAAMVPLQLVQAAAMDAADCGMSAAVSYVQRRGAELVREVIPSIA